MIPSDPYILFSYVNTKLRDEFSDLDSLCDALELDSQEIVDKLGAIGYLYNEEANKFE